MKINRKLVFALNLVLGLSVAKCWGWNPIADVRDNVQWTFGKAAEAGVAVKFAGGGDMDNGETTTSFLAGIADYRFLTLAYGGTRVNRTTSDMTDTVKIGLRVTKFFDFFKNPPTAEMSWMRNLVIGPSFAFSVFDKDRRDGTWLLDMNYRFGGN